jgi:hypothetical protein
MTARELATEARCATIPPGGRGRQSIVRAMRVILALLVDRLVTAQGGGGRVGSIPRPSRICVNRPDYPIALSRPSKGGTERASVVSTDDELKPGAGRGRHWPKMAFVCTAARRRAASYGLRASPGDTGGRRWSAVGQPARRRGDAGNCVASLVRPPSAEAVPAGTTLFAEDFRSTQVCPQTQNLLTTNGSFARCLTASSNISEQPTRSGTGHTSSRTRIAVRAWNRRRRPCDRGTLIDPPHGPGRRLEEVDCEVMEERR